MKNSGHNRNIEGRRSRKNCRTRLPLLRAEMGLTPTQAHQKLKQIEPEAPETFVGLIHIENRGTKRLDILRGLSTIYGVPLSVVEEAAKPLTANPLQSS